MLDFGCGGGFLLKNIRCRKRIGVEINPDARKNAIANGVECFASADEVPDDYASVIVSNNALEHTFHPLAELRALYKKLREGGTIVFVVPCESITYAYQPGDVNQAGGHLTSAAASTRGGSEPGFRSGSSKKSRLNVEGCARGSQQPANGSAPKIDSAGYADRPLDRGSRPGDAGAEIRSAAPVARRADDSAP